MSDLGLADQVTAVREFNRFYTKQIGVLQEGLLQSPFSLTQARVLFELAQHGSGITATELGATLELDAGYLSRLLRGFEEGQIIERRPSASDARQSVIRLTRSGWVAYENLDGNSRKEIAAMLERLPAARRQRLASAMTEIQNLLSHGAELAEPFRLRHHRPGDLGWIVERHGALYAREYGWDGSFEALVARIAADFVEAHDPARERCWIAERQGSPVGSVVLVRASDEVAKLRLLLVEPEARGLGIGRSLVAECIDFARSAGYRRLTLWTNSNLVAARRLYEEAGFELVAEEPHQSFGQDLVGETWDLAL